MLFAEVDFRNGIHKESSDDILAYGSQSSHFHHSSHAVELLIMCQVTVMNTIGFLALALIIESVC